MPDGHTTGPAGPTTKDSTPTDETAELVVRYRYGEGILLHGDTYPHKDAIKKAVPKWRWFRSMRQWGVTATRDKAMHREAVQRYADGLTKAGLHLTGARVLSSENGPAAFLLYEDSAGHRIALTIGRTGMDTDDTAFRFAGHDGVETIAWTDGGLTFTVTGQTGQDALRRIAAAVYAQMD